MAKKRKSKKEDEPEEIESLENVPMRELPEGAIFTVARHEARLKVRAEAHRIPPVQTLDQRDRRVDTKDLYGTNRPRKGRKR